MAVSVKSSHLVRPAEDTTAGIFPLSEIDQTKVWTLTPVVYIYKPNASSLQVTETLVNSLSRALVHFYPLAGRLKWIEGSRLEVNCNATGALFVEAESEGTLDDLDDFVPGTKMQQLVPNIDFTSPIDEIPLLALQVTRFSCGSLSVGIAISHVMVDGFSALHFTVSWAKLARGENIDVVPFHDRTVLRPSDPLVPPRFRHRELEPLPLVLGRSDANEERKKELSTALFKLTKSQVEKLKSTANEDVAEDRRPYSSYEAIGAHLWRSVCKARGGHDDQPTVVVMDADGRQRLKPSLPNGYFGNVAVPTVTEACLTGELISKPLKYAAGKLRESIERVTNEGIKSSIDFIKSRDDVSELRGTFHGDGSIKGRYLGNPNLMVTSWISLPVNQVDFGWGSPVYLTQTSMLCDGKCIIMADLSCKGSFIVVLCLQSAYMSDCNKLFYQHL